MKIGLVCFLVFINVVCGAQFKTPKQIETFADKVSLGRKLLVRFETFDTTDEKGRRLNAARSYYFNRSRKNLLLITAQQNITTPRMGFQEWYFFSNSKLVKIKVMPSRMICNRCSANYYFLNDSLVHKKEYGYSVSNIYSLVEDSKRLAMRVLHTRF